MEAELDENLAIRYKTQKLVDDEVERLRSIIRPLLSHRNTLSPISRLPSEILSHIFMIVQSQAYSSVIVLKSVSFYKWIAISHICRAWRYTALECITLWTRIDSRHKFMELFMERSLGAALHCKLDPRFGRVDPVLRLLQEVHRMSHVELDVASHESEKMLALFCTPAPLLQTLYISCEESFGLPLVNPILPENIFIGRSPNLSVLSLFRCNISLNAQILSTLTSLSVAKPSVTYARSQWLAILANIPHLAQLTLDDAFDDTLPDNGSPATRLLSTLRLSKLVLVGKEFSGDIAFFNHFGITNEAEVRFASETTTWGKELIRFLHSHAVVRHEFSRMPIHKLSIWGNSKAFFLDASHQNKDSTEQYFSLLFFKLSCAGGATGREPTKRDSWVEALSTLPLVNLMYFDSSIQTPSHIWSILLKNSPYLRNISVSNNSINGFLEFFLENYTKTCPQVEGHRSRHQENSQTQAEEKEGELRRGEWVEMVLPGLKTLVLRYCDMESLPNADKLGTVFRAREQNGAPLEYLWVSEFISYDEEWFARMEEFVPVDWDGEIPQSHSSGPSL